MIEKMKKVNKVSILLMSLTAVMVVMLLISGSSYAKWSRQAEQKNTNKISTGCFSLDYTDENSKSINLINTYPMTEEEAMKSEPYEFKIANNCSYDMYYSITLNTTGDSVLDEAINYKLIDEQGNVIGPNLLKNTKTYSKYTNYTYTNNGNSYMINNSYILTYGFLNHKEEKSDSKIFKLYLWIDENVTDTNIMGKTFNGKILTVSSNDKKALEIENTIVKFDANGGSVSYSSKSVTIRELYGDLPIPVKEGSEFVGWNGKNMFNKDLVLDNKKLNDEDLIDDLEYFVSDSINVETNKYYSISGAQDTIDVFEYDINGNIILKTSITNNSNFLIQDGVSYIKINGLLSKKDTIQIEESETPTEYEPYIITNYTTVVQENDHVLTALWK